VHVYTQYVTHTHTHTNVHTHVIRYGQILFSGAYIQHVTYIHLHARAHTRTYVFWHGCIMFSCSIVVVHTNYSYAHTYTHTYVHTYLWQNCGCAPMYCTHIHTHIYVWQHCGCLHELESCTYIHSHIHIYIRQHCGCLHKLQSCTYIHTLTHTHIYPAALRLCTQTTASASWIAQTPLMSGAIGTYIHISIYIYIYIYTHIYIHTHMSMFELQLLRHGSHRPLSCLEI
jgi:hypothetical protein